MGKEITAYTVLGVERNATHEQIAEAYKKAVFAHHPDRATGDPEAARLKLVRINHAWAKLRTPEDRAAYDRHLAELARPANGATPSASPSPADELSPEALLQHLRTMNGAGLGGFVAEVGQAAGLLDPSGAERVRQAAEKGASLGKDISELIGLVRGHQR